MKSNVSITCLLNGPKWVMSKMSTMFQMTQHLTRQKFLNHTLPLAGGGSVSLVFGNVLFVLFSFYLPIYCRKTNRDAITNVQNKLRLFDPRTVARKWAKENIVCLPQPRPLVSDLQNKNKNKNKKTIARCALIFYCLLW